VPEIETSPSTTAWAGDPSVIAGIGTASRPASCPGASGLGSISTMTACIVPVASSIDGILFPWGLYRGHRLPKHPRLRTFRSPARPRIPLPSEPNRPNGEIESTLVDHYGLPFGQRKTGF
jgi:hypothetical protein